MSSTQTEFAFLRTNVQRGMNLSGCGAIDGGRGMLRGMTDRIFEAVVAAIVAVGTGHTIASVYREREEYRRWREAVNRLRFGESNASS